MLLMTRSARSSELLNSSSKRLVSNIKRSIIMLKRGARREECRRQSAHVLSCCRCHWRFIVAAISIEYVSERPQLKSFMKRQMKTNRKSKSDSNLQSKQKLLTNRESAFWSAEMTNPDSSLKYYRKFHLHANVLWLNTRQPIIFSPNSQFGLVGRGWDAESGRPISFISRFRRSAWEFPSKICQPSSENCGFYSLTT